MCHTLSVVTNYTIAPQNFLLLSNCNTVAMVQPSSSAFSLLFPACDTTTLLCFSRSTFSESASDWVCVLLGSAHGLLSYVLQVPGLDPFVWLNSIIMCVCVTFSCWPTDVCIPSSLGTFFYNIVSIFLDYLPLFFPFVTLYRSSHLPLRSLYFVNYSIDTVIILNWNSLLQIIWS